MINVIFLIISLTLCTFISLYTNLLFILLILPLLGALIIAFIPQTKTILLKQIALSVSTLTFLLAIVLWILFDNSTANFQFLLKLNWIPSLNLNFIIGVDGISLFFIFLTTLLVPICLTASWETVTENLKIYLILFLFLETVLIAVFTVLDLLLFYICFESVLIPMFILMLVWGSRSRKVKASYLFFFYTLIGSLVMLFAVLIIFKMVGSLEYTTLLTIKFDPTLQKIFFLSFFLSFATKIPVIPVHVWLPEAHVEAPTVGSVLLAGVLLKLGTYGLLRFTMPLFPIATVFFTPLVYTIAVVSVIYSSITAIRQTDLKKIIAYSSVAHMNLILIGMFSLNVPGIEGSILQMLSHGFVSSALFLCVGVVYDRYHTRVVEHYSGLAHVMPIYVTLFLFFTLANIGFPGTSSFVGEVLIMIGAYKHNTVAAFFGSTGMFLGGAYSLWLFNRVSYGNLKTTYITKFSDVNKREFVMFIPLIIGTLVMGIYPSIFLDSIHPSVENLAQNLNHGTGFSVILHYWTIEW